MKLEQKEAAIEAILFASGDPVPASRIAEALDLDIDTVVCLTDRLTVCLEKDGHGVRIKRMDDSYQMCSNPDYITEVRRALDIRRNAPLSQAALEVLAIVAYNQPVTKAFIEQIRGVDCSGVISSLVQKGLVEEKGRLELPGRPLLYGSSPELLRCLNISSIQELPALPNQEAKETETEAASEQRFEGE